MCWTVLLFIPRQAQMGSVAHRAADADYLDEEADEAAVIARSNGMSMSMAPPQKNVASISPRNKAHYEEYSAKYGDGNSSE